MPRGGVAYARESWECCNVNTRSHDENLIYELDGQKSQWAARRLIEPVVAPIIESVSRGNLPERDTVITNPVLVCGRRFFFTE